MTDDGYQPNYVFSPGVTLQEMLGERGWTRVEFARRIGRPVETVNAIIQGKGEITLEIVLQLEQTLGASAGFWLNNERRYREHSLKRA